MVLCEGASVRSGSIASISSHPGHFRFTPTATTQRTSGMSVQCQSHHFALRKKASLFDHLVGAGE
jgi:hypothetical protein